MDGQDDTWRSLMQAAQSGERASYERLLHEITPFVRNVARRHCRHPHDLEEMVQETLLTVHRVRHTYDPARPFSPWLTAITQRRAIDILRRRKRVSSHESADMRSIETFAAAAANQELETVRCAEEVRTLLQQLPPRQREAVEALKLREMSLAEASAASGQSVGALKVNAHRALKALRALMQGREKQARGRMDGN
ncbi:MAG TPA: sigma-70 family RNA polymerase sigma factor [Steroidobacteraceae bacterium]|nr:sigma-70 family RNA polymerase sigma factor [Steroidobacteraceae bacterium]